MAPTACVGCGTVEAGWRANTDSCRAPPTSQDLKLHHNGKRITVMWPFYRRCVAAVTQQVSGGRGGVQVVEEEGGRPEEGQHPDFNAAKQLPPGGDIR